MTKTIYLQSACYRLVGLVASFVVAMVSGCGQSDQEQEFQREKARKAREEKVSAALESGPIVQKFQLEKGEILVLRIPQKDGYPLEYAKCIVWRDLETRTSAIHCPELSEL